MKRNPKHLEVRNLLLNSLCINEDTETEIINNLKTEENESISPKTYKVCSSMNIKMTAGIT
jgi:hypothetical protein